MYGDNDYSSPSSRRDSRPLSFITAPNSETINFENNPYMRPNPPRSPLLRMTSSDGVTTNVNGGSAAVTSPTSPSSRTMLDSSPHSPPHLNRANSDTAHQQFPLNDIDYESSPAAVAKELSNLQAIRRMSMDVNTADPDLPSFGSVFSMPTVAPSHSSDEDDASRLFWVPARLHPELAPTEFKTFIEDKVQKIRRRSGGEDTLSPDGVSRSASGGGLRRKKSMLSRQVQDGSGYKDGAERLERQKSGASNKPATHLENIEELENIVSDPSHLRRVSLEAMRKSQDSGVEVPVSEDMPILPGNPGLQTLKRSTRTAYRRGSLRKGERVPFSRRTALRQSETDEESPATSPTSATHPDASERLEGPEFGLQRVQTEPMPARHRAPENFSRPTRNRTPPLSSGSIESESSAADSRPTSSDADRRPPSQQRSFHSRIASNGRTTAQLPGVVPAQSIPQIIETPPAGEAPRSGPMYFQPPERKSSHQPPPKDMNHQPPPRGPHPGRSPPPPSRQPQQPQQPQPPQPPPQHPGRQLSSQRRAEQQPRPDQTLNDLASHPTPLPGNQSTRTDHLSTIPFEDKKAEKKSRDKKESADGGKKSSWWFLGGDDKKKEEERKEKERREQEEREAAKKTKSSKLLKTSDKSHDNTRLDVLQASIDGGRPRESLVLDRESIKLEEERKKESNRKSSEGKKEKDGIFSSLFGGSKKKSEREASNKRGSAARGLSPEPPPKILKPDIDYNWTRFSLLEERAIYRMAHIKLANPRRELYSQVLLSNFMYSYLAKVQQMHPQIQIAQSPAQKQQVQRQMQQQQQHKQQQSSQSKEQQPEEFAQYQRYQEVR